MHFQTFRLQPPHAPPHSGHASCSGRAWPAIRSFGLSPVLRTSLITRSLVSRIRPYRVCVAALNGPQFYGLSVDFQLLSTPCRHDAVTFSYWREAPPERDLPSPVHACSQAHECGCALPLFIDFGSNSVWATRPYVEGYDVERYVIKEPFHLLVFWVCSNRLWRSEK